MSDWWKERQKRQKDHATRTWALAWRASLPEPHADDVARAFDNDVSPERFVAERIAERDRKAREEAEAEAERLRIESTCLHADQDGSCWGQIEGSYAGPGTYADFVYTCEGHRDVPTGGAYVPDPSQEST